MAQAYKCDRCERLKEGEKHVTVRIEKYEDLDGKAKTLDLCHECYIQVDIFIATCPAKHLPLNPPKLDAGF